MWSLISLLLSSLCSMWPSDRPAIFSMLSSVAIASFGLWPTKRSAWRRVWLQFTLLSTRLGLEAKV